MVLPHVLRVLVLLHHDVTILHPRWTGTCVMSGKALGWMRASTEIGASLGYHLGQALYFSNALILRLYPTLTGHGYSVSCCTGMGPASAHARTLAQLWPLASYGLQFALCPFSQVIHFVGLLLLLLQELIRILLLLPICFSSCCHKG